MIEVIRSYNHHYNNPLLPHHCPGNTGWIHCGFGSLIVSKTVHRVRVRVRVSTFLFHSVDLCRWKVPVFAWLLFEEPPKGKWSSVFSLLPSAIFLFVCV